MRGWYWWLLGLLALGAGAPMLSPRPVAPRPVAVMPADVQPHPRQFANGLPNEVGFFPIAVWLQQPNRAAAFAAVTTLPSLSRMGEGQG